MRNILTFILLFCCLSAQAVRFPEDAKANNQLADSVNRTITLIFPIDQAHYNIPKDSIQAVYAWGSISDFHNAVPSCLMTDFSEDSCFYRTFSYDEIARPGDSGQPESQFCAVLTNGSTLMCSPDMMNSPFDERLFFTNGYDNVLLILPGGPAYMTTDLDELHQRNLQARVFRPLADFDLSDPVEQHNISNFRLAAGTSYLYRSYHPFYPSMTKRETEPVRLHWVAQLATQAGIQSAVCLTGDLSANAGQTYVCAGDTYLITIPEYYQSLMDNGHYCNADITSAECYYYPQSATFASCMKRVVEFISDDSNPLPIQIHCAIGADRTGVVCAVISALCGADWQSIQDDYSATGNMQTQTYRHPNRLRYMFQQLTGLLPDSCTMPQLAAAIRHHFVDEMGVLTNEQIDRMVYRLTNSTATNVLHYATDGVNKWYDVLGRPVTTDYSGVRIGVGAQEGSARKCRLLAK